MQLELFTMNDPTQPQAGDFTPEGDLTSGAMYSSNAERDTPQATYNRRQSSGDLVFAGLDAQQRQNLGDNLTAQQRQNRNAIVSDGEQQPPDPRDPLPGEDAEVGEHAVYATGATISGRDQGGFTHTLPDQPAGFTMGVMGGDFGAAIHALKAGWRVTRKGWNGKGMSLSLQTPDKHSKMTLPYIFMQTTHGDLVPWLASQTDMLADDWRVVP